MIVPKSRKIAAYSNGHWEFPSEMGAPQYVGFIYVILDSVMEKFYIGKKNYRSYKGLESDWKGYTTSSKLVQDILLSRDSSEFRFICLEEYKTKGGLSFAETWSLCHVEAPARGDCLNVLIPKVSWKTKETITAKHKERLHDCGII